MTTFAPPTPDSSLSAGRKADPTTDGADLAGLLAQGAIRTVFQPVVHLDDRSVAGYEALTRGPAETVLESPVALFGAARAAGLLPELDRACRETALSTALAAGLTRPLHVFVNVEPAVLGSTPPLALPAPGADGGRLDVVLEITERALASRPAELLATVGRVRELGWRVALDDVGADPASLAFMEILRPDVVKLDLKLVQERPSRAVAEIMSAVNAYAERSEALLLAEGIETEEHLLTAVALGARLGQGWLFGRPTACPSPPAADEVRPLVLPRVRARVQAPLLESPFAALPIGTTLRTAPKKLLIELSKQLEREAARLGDTCVVAGAFQEARHFTPATARRYRVLSEEVGFVAAIGEGLAAEPAPGVRGASLHEQDPVRGEWDITVLNPHYSAALLARDLGDPGPDVERRFEYALTYQRDTVVAATQRLLARVAPEGRVGEPFAGAAAPVPWVELASVPKAVGDLLVRRALDAATSGVTIADMTSEDHPLVYANAAFEQLAGLPAGRLVGRNCRFIQSATTDPAAVARIREAIAQGRECRETLLNHRGPGHEPWWNEIHLSPVTDQLGEVVAYIGVQNDVTARVEAERDLRLESERSRRYLARIEHLAYTDSLTGLRTRHRFHAELEEALRRAVARDRAVAVLFLDLDGFKQVNDTWGHACGDELLKVMGSRISSLVTGPHLAARLGGDEFLVALVDLHRDEGRSRVDELEARLGEALTRPVMLQGHGTVVGVSIGASQFPGEASSIDELLQLADQRMYEAKPRPR